jgi:hypothetical protein
VTDNSVVFWDERDGRERFSELASGLSSQSVIMWWEIELRLVVINLILLAVLLISLPAQYHYYSFLSWISSFYLIGSFLISQSYQLVAHWRTLLIFTLNGILSILLLINPSHPMPLFRSFGAVLLIVASLTLAIILIFPVPSKPHLNGRFKRVGTCSFQIPIQLPPDAQRYKDITNYEVTVQCWFPISDSQTPLFKFQRYFNLLPQATLWSSGHPHSQSFEALQLHQNSALSAELPSFIFSHLLLSITNSEYLDFHDLQLPLSAEPLPGSEYPVAIYSHGMWSWRQISSSTFEMLASNGYIVFSVDHLPSAMITRPFPGVDNYQPFDYHLPPSIPPGSTEERTHYQRGVDRRCHEIIALINYLSQGEVKDKLHLCLQKIHLFGHSFGGGTVAGVTCRDQRITSTVLCK